MNLKNIIITSVLILFVSCVKKTTTNSSLEIVKVSPHDIKEYVNLSEIADSVKCIKLQTDSNDIMGRVREIVIKKKYIYAMDISQQMIFVFDKMGKFVAKLDKRGQGVDEYVLMGPVFIDEDENYIELVNYKGKNSCKLKYTNITFKFVDSSPFPNIRCNACKRVDNYLYFSTQQLDNIVNDRNTNAGLVIIDDKGNQKTFFDKNIETKRSSFSPNIESFTKNSKNELFVSLMYDNIFYQLKEGAAVPIVKLDFGKFCIDNSVGLKSIEKQMKYIQKVNGLASFPVLNINNSEIMAFSYYFKKDEKDRMYSEKDFCQYIKFKKKNNIYHVKKIRNDITDFPSHIYISSYFFNCAHEVWYDDYLIDVVLPNYYFMNNEIDSVFVDGIGEITAYDNPIIVMMKLKK